MFSCYVEVVIDVDLNYKIFHFRKIRTYLLPASEAKIRQEPICNHLCDWSGATASWPLQCLDTNARVCAKNRILQPKTERISVFSFEQCLLGDWEHR